MPIRVMDRELLAPPVSMASEINHTIRLGLDLVQHPFHTSRRVPERRLRHNFEADRTAGLPFDLRDATLHNAVGCDGYADSDYI